MRTAVSSRLMPASRWSIVLVDVAACPCRWCTLPRDREKNEALVFDMSVEMYSRFSAIVYSMVTRVENLPNATYEAAALLKLVAHQPTKK